MSGQGPVHVLGITRFLAKTAVSALRRVEASLPSNVDIDQPQTGRIVKWLLYRKVA